MEEIMGNDREETAREDSRIEEKAGEGEVTQYVERKRWVFFGLPFTFTKYTINKWS